MSGFSMGVRKLKGGGRRMSSSSSSGGGANGAFANEETKRVYDAFRNAFQANDAWTPEITSDRKVKKKRQIDAVMEELSSSHHAHEEEYEHRRRKSDYSRGSRTDTDDRYTTNLYVGNLSPETNELRLKMAFERYGTVSSVKIMWPRTEEEHRRGRNCGFVNYAKREDAERARMEMQEYRLDGHCLNVGWGKDTNKDTYRATKVKSPRVIEYRAPPPPPPSMKKSENFDVPNTSSMIRVQLPKSRHQRDLIDALAREVAREAITFEKALEIEREDNPDYSILYQTPWNATAIYYRWKLFLITNSSGEEPTNWSNSPFQIVKNGPFYLPPPCFERKKNPSSASQLIKQSAVIMTGQQIAKARDSKRGRDNTRMTEDEYDELEDILKHLTVDRKSICGAMGFALDCSEASADIVDVIVTSMLNSHTKLHSRLAHLYLISDILHNSTAPVQNASVYRTKFQEVLPSIFYAFQQSLMNMTGRMSANQLKEKVMAVLRAWESWSIFPPMYLIGLQVVFMASTPPKCIIDEDHLSKITVPFDALKRKGRQAGLVTTGTREDLIRSLATLDSFLSEHVIQLNRKGSENAIEMQATAQLLHDTLVEWGICEEEKEEAKTIDTKEEESSEELPPPSKSGLKSSSIVAASEEDLDGEPMDEDLDDDIDGEPLSDDDSEGDDNIDGSPLDEEDAEEVDLDGEPID